MGDPAGADPNADVYHHDKVSYETVEEGEVLATDTRVSDASVRFVRKTLCGLRWSIMVVPCLVLLNQACAQTAAEPKELAAARSKGQVDVISLARTPRESSTEPGVVCSYWTLRRDDVKLFFSRARVLTAEEFHDYDVYPCSYVGRLFAAGQEYEFGINAGGFGSIRLSNSDKLTFGCKTECAKVFPDL